MGRRVVVTGGDEVVGQRIEQAGDRRGCIEAATYPTDRRDSRHLGGTWSKACGVTSGGDATAAFALTLASARHDPSLSAGTPPGSTYQIGACIASRLIGVAWSCRQVPVGCQQGRPERLGERDGEPHAPIDRRPSQMRGLLCETSGLLEEVLDP